MNKAAKRTRINMDGVAAPIYADENRYKKRFKPMKSGYDYMMRNTNNQSSGYSQVNMGYNYQHGGGQRFPMKQLVNYSYQNGVPIVHSPMTPPVVKQSVGYLKPKPSQQETNLSEYEKIELESQQLNKRHLLSKYRQIQNEHLPLIGCLMKCIEASLQSVSNKLMSQEKQMYLIGVYRMGLVEKGVFLSFDRHIDLIALTASVPTYLRVKQIVTELESSDLFRGGVNPSFDKSRLSLSYDESLVREHAHIVISYKLSSSSDDVEYKFRVAFTSRELIEKKVTDYSQLPALQNPSDFYLPLDKCLSSLNETARINWFIARLKPIENAILILGILREMCHRHSSWSCMSDWLLEIMIEKCFRRDPFADLTLKFRQLFELISAGVLLLPELNIPSRHVAETQLALVDPCQSEYYTTPSDVAAKPSNINNSLLKELTETQREEMTCDAQRILRFIAFNKINQVI